MKKYAWIDIYHAPGQIITIGNHYNKLSYSDNGKGFSIHKALQIRKYKSDTTRYYLYEIKPLGNQEFEIISLISDNKIEKLKLLL